MNEERSDASHDLSRAWEEKARAALGWREEDPLEPVLEALALSVAVEITGDLAELPPSLRDELRRLGQRALLHVGGLFGRASSDADEDAQEALRIAVALARDGLRALSGRAPDEEPERPPPSGREIARLLAGRLDAYEAASIARRVRASPSARDELAWALRRQRGADDRDPAAEVPRLDAPIAATTRLAAAEGEEMRDPASGRRLSALIDPGTGVQLAELFAFSGRVLAVYAASGEPVRVEGEGLRTETMQPGYWAGRHEGGGAVQGVAHVGDLAQPFRVDLD